MRFNRHYEEARREMCRDNRNIMSVPYITKVSRNMGVKSLLSKHDKALDFVSKQMLLITGQKPRIVRAKKSCNGFFIKKRDINALHVTWNGEVSVCILSWTSWCFLYCLDLRTLMASKYHHWMVEETFLLVSRIVLSSTK